MFGADVSGSGATMCARMGIPRTGGVRAFENELSSAIRTLVSLPCVVPGEEGLSRVGRRINERFTGPALDGDPGSDGESSSLLRGLYPNRIFASYIVSERCSSDREKRQCANCGGDKSFEFHMTDWFLRKPS